MITVFRIPKNKYNVVGQYPTLSTCNLYPVQKLLVFSIYNACTLVLLFVRYPTCN